MKPDLSRIHQTNLIRQIAVGTLALTVSLGLPRLIAAQDQAQGQQSQAGDVAAPVQPPDARDPEAAPDSTAPPTAEPATQSETPAPEASPQTQAPPSAPSSGWHYNPGPQDPAPQSAPPAASGAPAAQAQPPAVSTPSGALPQALTVPTGTVISVRLTQWLSSDQNHAGDAFNAELDQPIVVDGWVVARRGQSVLGHVVLAQKSNHGNNESRLGLELAELTLVDGQRLTVSTELVQDATKRSSGHDAATVGATTALGAILGAAIGGGQGAAIGAGAGVTAGMATVMVTAGRPTVLRPEQLLTFRLQSPVDIDTERGHVAFRPVTQSDYGRTPEPYTNTNPPRLRRPAPAPYPPPYPYGPYGPVGYAAPPYDGAYCGGPPLWSCDPASVYLGLGFWGGWGFAPGGGVVFGPGFRR